METSYKALKSSEFIIEDTHLPVLERLRKLLEWVLVVFAWIYHAGIYLDSLIPIKVTSHGRKLRVYSNMD